MSQNIKYFIVDVFERYANHFYHKHIDFYVFLESRFLIKNNEIKEIQLHYEIFDLKKITNFTTSAVDTSLMFKYHLM